MKPPRLAAICTVRTTTRNGWASSGTGHLPDSSVKEPRPVGTKYSRLIQTPLEAGLLNAASCTISSGVSPALSILSRSLYRSHVLTTFLGPVLGAMMKQVCWHSPCHCFLMLALLRPSRRTRQNRSRQQSAARGC